MSKMSSLCSVGAVEAGDHMLQSVVEVKNGASPKSQMSRGNKMIVYRLSIFIVIALLLSGCGAHSMVTAPNTPFYLAYDLEEVILDQSKLSTITSTNGLVIDGVVVSNKNMRSSNASSLKLFTKAVADVLPGEYNVKATHTNEGTAIQMESITYNFEAGRIYRIRVGISRVVVDDITNPEIVRKIALNRNNAVFEQKK